MRCDVVRKMPLAKEYVVKKSLVVLLVALMALTLVVGCKKEPEVKNLDYSEFVGTWIYGDNSKGEDSDYVMFGFKDDKSVTLKEYKDKESKDSSFGTKLSISGSTITITSGDDEWKYNAEFKEDNLILTPVGDSTWMESHKDLKEIKLEKCYTVTFNSDGGSTVYSQTVKKGNKATKPTDPTKTDNYLVAWNTEDGAKFNFNTEITEDIELKAAWKPTYTVGGQGPAGGIIFYDVDADNASGNADGLIAYDCGWRYLEAATSDVTTATGSADFAWGSNGNYSTGTAVGTGKDNTELLKSNGISNFPAAQACTTYTNNGYSDWFLPSVDELKLIYSKIISNSEVSANVKDYFSSSEDYWSSSTYPNTEDPEWAYRVKISTGHAEDSLRTYGLPHVRPVRSF